MGIVRPDVAHLCYYYGYREAVQKVIDNICKNSDNHIILPIKEVFGDENNVISILNDIKPKIIHIHFNSLFDQNCFGNLTYKPNAIIQTIHGNKKTNYGNIVDQIVCIHDEAAKLNDNSIVIENTVDVMGAVYNPCFNSIVTGFRIIKEKIDTNIVNYFGSIQGDIDVFGMPFVPTKHSKKIESTCPSNVRLYHWNRFIENLISKRVLFVYAVEYNNKEICYGLSLMEAACIGMPIVALRRRQDNQKYIINGYNGLIADSLEDLAECCNMLYKNVNLLKMFAENAKKHIISLSNTMPEQYNALYEKYL